MDNCKILVCYSGGLTFIGDAEKCEDQVIILKNPRIVFNLRDAEGKSAFSFDYVVGLPHEIILFQYDALWIPNQMVVSCYLDEIAGWSSESFSKSELLN